MRQSSNKLNVFNLFRHCRKYEISFDIVAGFGDIVVGVDGTIGDIVADFGDNVAVFGNIVAGVDGALDIEAWWFWHGKRALEVPTKPNLWIRPWR